MVEKPKSTRKAKEYSAEERATIRERLVKGRDAKAEKRRRLNKKVDSKHISEATEYEPETALVSSV